MLAGTAVGRHNLIITKIVTSVVPIFRDRQLGLTDYHSVQLHVIYRKSANTSVNSSSVKFILQTLMENIPICYSWQSLTVSTKITSNIYFRQVIRNTSHKTSDHHLAQPSLFPERYITHTFNNLNIIQICIFRQTKLFLLKSTLLELRTFLASPYHQEVKLCSLVLSHK